MKSNSAPKPLLLWFDLTHDRSSEALIQEFNDDCESRLAKAANVSGNEQTPDMICMHFDQPDALGLNLLLQVKRTTPSTPITMFTEQHSEELAIWALRSGVWDYLSLPLSAPDKSRYLLSLNELCELRRNNFAQAKKPLLSRPNNLPDSIRLTSDYHKNHVLQKASLYIDQHFKEPIDQKALAKRFGMTPFRFCRLFKELHGLGFVEYILRKRMECAKQLLDNSQMPITSIGYAVGFKDPAYFARAFKQYTGCPPSEYRKERHPDTRGQSGGGAEKCDSGKPPTDAPGFQLSAGSPPGVHHPRDKAPAEPVAFLEKVYLHR